MYIIKFLDKRYNSKTFESYEAARKYVRRLVTKVTGAYQDSYTQVGFSIVAK
jgi:hypothetical protein